MDQPALPAPLRLWSRKMRKMIRKSSANQATSSMNQNIETRMSHKPKSSSM